MAGRNPFSALRAKMSEESKARSHEKYMALREEYSLGELRRARKISQEEIGRILQIQQPSVAKLEKRTDMYISTLRRVIEAMGGTLEINAIFPGHCVKIRNFSEINGEQGQQNTV